MNVFSFQQKYLCLSKICIAIHFISPAEMKLLQDLRFSKSNQIFIYNNNDN